VNPRLREATSLLAARRTAERTRLQDINMQNTPEIKTERLILRRFTENDAVAFFDIMSDKEVNTYLPWFPFETLEEAKIYLQEKFLKTYEKPSGFRYAICLKSDNLPIGYIGVNDDDSFDFGYGLKKEYWHKGLVSEASKAAVELIKESGIPYITATHDVNNSRSGNVMKNIGMTYCYSYEEQWQPKNFPVIFRMYQLNFDGQNERVYRKYWDKYPKHFVEDNV
jgi:RimJ/RimL family protein N-acetyltransferase